MRRSISAVVWVILATGCLLLAQQPQSGTPPPVPVATPKFVEKTPKKDDKKKDVKKEDGKNEEDKEPSAQIPPRFVKNVLEAMPVNSAGYVPVTAVRVDSDRRVWLQGDQAYSKKSETFVVLVSKDEAGSLHVVLDGVTHQWVAGEFDRAGWLAVKTIRDSGSPPPKATKGE